MQELTATIDVPQALFKKRNAKSKATTRKREVTPPPNNDSDSGFTSSEDESGRPVKRRRKNVGVVASSKSGQPARPPALPESSAVPSTIRPTVNEATKTSDWYDEQPEKDRQKLQTSEVAPLDGTYKGIANYSSFIQKNPDRMKQVGPVKQSSNVRTITVTDFAPDVCKDYKQTGFCGFGDSCKFLHAREDYKQGWALDREWEIETKGKKLTGRTVASANRDAQQKPEDEDEDKLLEKIPFACILCKKSYKSPIVTKCQHYFCEACALHRYRKDPSCAACGTSTGGVFNVAKKLDKLLERKRDRERQKAEGASESVT